MSNGRIPSHGNLPSGLSQQDVDEQSGGGDEGEDYCELCGKFRRLTDGVCARCANSDDCDD